MDSFYHGPLGAFHFATATAALVLGLIVLLSKKGTSRHKKLGYAYVTAMLSLNLSAIPIRNLFGGFGPFHLFILISLPTVLAALYYPLFGRSKANWMQRHLEFMYWSYVGLIAAFVNEVIVRLPIILASGSGAVASESSGMSGWVIAGAFAATGLVMGAGEYVFREFRKQVVS